MSSLTQYIELYDANRNAIDRHSPGLLRRWHALAREALDGAALPTERTEGYEKTSIEAMLAPDLGVNINRLNFQADVAAAFRCDIPNMSTLLGVTVNDMFHPTRTLVNNLPEGVAFSSLSRLLERGSAPAPRIAEAYGSVAPLDSAPVALNTLMAQDAVVVYIPRGLKMAKPLQMVSIFASPTPLAAFRRLLVIVEEDAEAQLLLCDHTQGAGPYIGSQVTEVILERGARFDLYDVEKSNAATSRHAMTFVSQGADSNLVTNTTTLTCGLTRNELDVQLDGEGCRTLLAGMAIASERQHVDNNTYVSHNRPRCHSNQLYKYVLDDEAVGAFEGVIEVTPEAPYTEAYQSNRNIVAGPRALMHAKPQLLIYNDEVRCSHGATTGQLDEEALFYMRTRGIPLQEARTMLMQAFMVDVIDTVRLESLRDRLRHLVERRFCGGGDCADCSALSGK